MQTHKWGTVTIPNIYIYQTWYVVLYSIHISIHNASSRITGKRLPLTLMDLLPCWPELHAQVRQQKGSDPITADKWSVRQPIDESFFFFSRWLNEKKKTDFIPSFTHMMWMGESSLRSYRILTAERLPHHQNTLISIAGYSRWQKSDRVVLQKLIGRTTSVQPPGPYMDRKSSSPC